MTNKHFAVIGFLSIVVFWSTYFIMSLNRDDYSFLTKAISELGSVDAPNKWLWNLFGYIIPGIFISIFCYGLVKNLANYGRYKLPLVGLVLSGLLMSFSGAFPGDFDNKRSMTMLMHSVGSFGRYIFPFGRFYYPFAFEKVQLLGEDSSRRTNIGLDDYSFWCLEFHSSKLSSCRAKTSICILFFVDSLAFLQIIQ